MDLKDFLTTEELRKKFKNQFDLVLHAINVAENMIKTGRGPRVKLDVQNRALIILEEIAHNKDYLDEIPAEPEEEIQSQSLVAEAKNLQFPEGKKSSRNSLSKITTPKKGRKILSEHAAR